MTIGVILPAYNVARHLPQLLMSIRQMQPDVRVVVVDDGSSDGSGEAAAASGIELITHKSNRGKGAALLSGFSWALENELDMVFTMDADGQHLPAEMQNFLDAAEHIPADVFVGTRMERTGEMPWIRRKTNQFTSWVVSKLAGCEIPDSQNGFRLFRTSCLSDLHTTSSRFDFESEILVQLGRQGARIASVPISTVYAEEKSSIHPLVDTWRFFKLVFHLVFASNHSDRGHR